MFGRRSAEVPACRAPLFVSYSNFFSPRISTLTRPAYVAILIGLLVMMWPVLTKVQYERLPLIFKRRSIWLHIGISIILNWIVAPFIMLALAWATLPEAALERERKGVILVGIARCIGTLHYAGKCWSSRLRGRVLTAMVLIWNGLACGDPEYCAILVCVNSILQVTPKRPRFCLMLMGDSLLHPNR
jgi:arsenite transporter